MSRVAGKQDSKGQRQQTTGRDLEVIRNLMLLRELEMLESLDLFIETAPHKR